MVMRLTLPIMGRHRALFVKGGLAAVIVVLCRLALPWPLKLATDRWLGGEAATTDLAAWYPAAFEPILVLGLGFVFLAVLLGMGDYLERLNFARFSVASVRDLRDETIAAIGRSGLKVSKGGRGDLVARLVGDTARVKAGLKGFLVHVATNGLLLPGMAVVLFLISPGLGLVFAVTFLATLAVTIWGAAHLFHLALRQRKKEGELAEQIQANLRSRETHGQMTQTNRTSSRYEVAQTRTQGIVTWCAHGLFGLAVFAALWIGAADLEAGAIGPGDMVAFMLYAILLRAPMVQLARQGSRTGKILGSAYRVVQIMNAANKKAAKRARKFELLDHQEG
jgi:ABC-type multidrug transport system fused ATPase/permease subunit